MPHSSTPASDTGRGRRGGFRPLTALFILALLAPWLQSLMRLVPEPPGSEKRLPAPAPVWSWGGVPRLPAACDAWFADRFGLRRSLIRGHNLLHLKLLGVSPLPAVLAGRRGWLFLAEEGGSDRPLRYFRNLMPLSGGELQAAAEPLRRRQRELARRGIACLTVVAPSKESLYPEFMPGRIRRAGPLSRLDQLTGEFRREPDAALLDLRPALRVAAVRHPVYDRTDSHWNDYGAWIASREIVARLARGPLGFAPAALPEADVVYRLQEGGDLAGMLSLSDCLREARPHPVPRRSPRARRVRAWMESAAVRVAVWETPGAGRPSALVFCDSFADRLAPFLAEHFRRAVFVTGNRSRFDPLRVAIERPDVVIVEMAERYL